MVPMTLTADYAEMHQTVDRLNPRQLSRLLAAAQNILKSEPTPRPYTRTARGARIYSGTPGTVITNEMVEAALNDE